MYISKVSLKNIRGFELLEFDLSRRDKNSFAGWTVFTGDNGSGKSTLLKAIAVALTGKDTARALQPSFQRWVREGINGQESSIRIVVKPGDGDSFAKGGKISRNEFPAKIILKPLGKDVILESEKQKSTLPERGIWSSESKGWFSCGYGPFRRVFGASPEATRAMVAPTTERFVTMFQEAASLAEVNQWMKELSHKALEKKTDEKEQLDLLLSILRDELMPNQITIDTIDSDGLWLRDRNGLRLPWSEMSDGYRAALALLADILRHLINAYGHEGLTETDPKTGKLRIIREGVVLIDEVDAHLHPEWQRQIGFWLKGHFPNIQFLVTTHSPLICQAADRNGIFVLPEPGSDEKPRQLSNEEYEKIIAAKSDTILLTSAFGLQNTRSELAVQSRERYSDLKAKQNSGTKLNAEEKREFQQLELFARDDEE
jgi:predicted ATP-binding protein involved in virulence